MAGSVWVPVNAQMKGFVAQVVKEASGAARQGGKAFEDEFAKSGQKAGASLAKKVEQATDTLSRARSQEAQAAKDLAVAEQQLEQLRASGSASASSLIAAENKVATAKAKTEDASMRVSRSEKDLEAARSGSETTANTVKRAEDNLSQARIASTDAAGKVRAAEAAVGEARDKAKSGAAGVAQAEQKLIDTRDRYGANTKETARAERELEKAKKDADKANLAVTKAEGDLGKARTNLENATDKLAAKELLHKQAIKDVDEAQKNAGKSVKDMGDGVGILDGKLGSLASAAAGAVAGFVGFNAIKDTLWNVGVAFDDLYDSIRVGTGASGEAFAGLQESARAVADTIPAMDGGMAQIGTTLADLNTRLGATGPELETLTSQFVQLSNMGIDADINEVSKALQGFGVEAKDMPATMDKFFQISQATGLSITELAQSAVKGGPQLRQFGFDVGDSAALVGTLDKAGLDADKTIAGMGKALMQFAKDGKDAPQALRDTVTEIGDFISSGNEAKALDVAGKLFGTKGAAQFVDAVKQGTLNVDDFVAATGATKDTILGIAEETADGAEAWQLFKQQAMLAVEPLATALFGVLTPALETVSGGLKTMGDWVQRNSTWLGPLAAGLGAFAGIIGGIATAMALWTGATKAWAAVQAIATGEQLLFNSAVFANPITWIVAAIVAAGVALWAFFTKTEKGREIWGKLTEFMKQAWEKTTKFFTDGYNNYVKPVFDWISEKWDSLKNLFSGGIGDGSALGGAFDTVKNAAGTAVDWVKQKWNDLGPAMGQIYNTWIKPVVDGFKAGIDLLGQAITWWYQNVTKPALDLIGQAFNLVWNTFIKPAIDGFKQGLDLLGQVIGIVVNGFIIPAWQFLGSMISSVWNNIIKPVWDFMKNAVGLVADILTGNFDNIGNRFSGMGDAIHGIVHGVIKTAMDFFKGLVEMVGNAWETFKNVVQTVVDTVKNKIQEMGDRLAAFPGQVKSLFAQAGQWLVSAGRNIINGLWEGMKNAWSSVKNWLSDHLSFNAIGALIGLRGGGIVAYADGGITQYVQGGINQLEAYANGGGRENHRAQIAPAGAWRVWAEPETGGEAYIPLASSKRGRSTAILDEVANRFGYVLVDAKTGREYQGDYRGDLGPQDVRAFADGGVTTADDLRRFVEGEGASRSLEGAPYVWGGSNWGDCSGTQSAIAAFAIGDNPFPRKFDTGSQASWLSAHGFQRGRGGEGDLRIGFRNGGPAGGHTAGTLPDGTNVEMGGGRGNGQIGGGAAGAWDSYFNEFFYLPIGPGFERVGLGDLGDLSPDSHGVTGVGNSDTVTQPNYADSSGASGSATDENTISGMAGSLAKEVVSGQLADALGVFGIPDTLPSWLTGARDLYKQNTGEAKTGRPGTSAAEQHAIENHDSAVTSMTPSEIKADPQLKGMDSMDVVQQPKVPEWGPEFFAHEISRQAKSMSLGADGAKIGVATALVESGDPMKMYANNGVPESLKFRHDAVGSDHDSVGLFQQRDNGAWGTVADRMDPFKSAGMFFRELAKFDWRSMEPGAAAQKVQRSAFPDRYATKMNRAEQMVSGTGLFSAEEKKPEAAVYDSGGVLKHGMAGFNFSKKPEAVLTNEQWKLLTGLGEGLSKSVGSTVSGAVSAGVSGGAGMAAGFANTIVPGSGAAIQGVAGPAGQMAGWYAGEVAEGWTDSLIQFGEQAVGLVTEPIQDVLGPLSSGINSVLSRVQDVPVGGSNATSEGGQAPGNGPTTVINVQSVAQALEAQRHIETRELAGFGVNR